MSSTHLSLHYHLVFRTKNDEPVITSAWRDRLHAYLGGVIRTLGGAPEAIGRVADHVHLLGRTTRDAYVGVSRTKISFVQMGT